MYSGFLKEKKRERDVEIRLSQGLSFLDVSHSPLKELFLFRVIVR